MFGAAGGHDGNGTGGGFSQGNRGPFATPNNSQTDRDSKRLAFIKASAVCQHVIMLLCKKQQLAGPLTDVQVRDLNKVEDLSLPLALSAYNNLCLTANNPDIVIAFLALVAPQPGTTFNPIQLWTQILGMMRAELDMPVLQLPMERSFFLNIEANLIKLPPAFPPK